MKKINVLLIGDVVGDTGMRFLSCQLPRLKEKHNVHVVVVNGENAAKNGRGITPSIMQDLRNMGVDVVTSGNHLWAKQNITTYLESHEDLLRPANYPGVCPGRGVTIFSVANTSIAVVNLQGRVFFRELLDCPFRTMLTLLTYIKQYTPITIVDFHAEATAEKLGLAYFLDGKVSALVGTHTHVQTADERILPGGTAYISDVGMVGSFNSIIGFCKESATKAMMTQMPTRFEVDDKAPYVLGAVLVTINTETGLATSITRIRIVDEELSCA
jgi:2',3'-cyclic-nucleotide 2'-phosphodiesterase